MKKIIFDTELNGHHLEYLHHLYIGAIGDKDNFYIFAVPDNFSDYKGNFEWPDAQNVSFCFIPQKEISRCHSNMYLRIFRESFLAKKIILATKADEIFFIYLMQVIPVLPLIIRSKIGISGIIYNVYLYRNFRGIRKLFEIFCYRVMAKKLSAVYILNDAESATQLNAFYKTKIFKTLPDPIPENAFRLYSKPTHELIYVKGKTFLHFGYMSRRKGTIEIAKAIHLLPKRYSATFIFAGIVDPEIKEEFYDLVASNINPSINIIVKDKYCDYDLINDLCHISDCILIPYSNTAQSSGVLGYAAAHNIPVIGPKDGLLGNLIRRYNLGPTIDNNTPETLVKAILKFKKHFTNSSYIQTNTIDNFVKTLIFNKTVEAQQ